MKINTRISFVNEWGIRTFFCTYKSKLNQDNVPCTWCIRAVASSEVTNVVYLRV